MWVKWEGGTRSRTTGVAEARTRNDHLDGTAGNIGMGYAHTHHPVVALSAGAFGERCQGAGNGLIEERLIFRHMAANGIDDGLAHIAQDVGTANGAGVDELTLVDGAVLDSVGRHQPH